MMHCKECGKYVCHHPSELCEDCMHKIYIESRNAKRRWNLLTYGSTASDKERLEELSANYRNPLQSIARVLLELIEIEDNRK